VTKQRYVLSIVSRKFLRYLYTKTKIEVCECVPASEQAWRRNRYDAGSCEELKFYAQEKLVTALRRRVLTKATTRCGSGSKPDVHHRWIIKNAIYFNSLLFPNDVMTIYTEEIRRKIPLTLMLTFV
jgi:hypothetical protein